MRSFKSMFFVLLRKSFFPEYLLVVASKVLKVLKWTKVLSVSNGNIITAKNTVISPNSLVWQFCGKAQFPHSFGRITRNYAEIVPFRKISTPENYVKLRYFMQCYVKMSVFGVILIRIFQHSDWIPRDTPYLSVFSPNAGKYVLKWQKLRSDHNKQKANNILQHIAKPQQMIYIHSKP